jgi:3-deoxy-D-manno-octulosonate 8-phosphate phosphatase (KDO 8-P phosphatase)
VKIFLTDVDGVLTDATILLDGKTEFKQFNIQDGMGLRLLQHLGIPVGWVSNRKSLATSVRAKELKVDYLWQKSLPKVAAVESILKKAKLKWEDACFMSDDINDLAVLNRVGLPIAVANARQEILKSVKHVTKAKGGEGAVREVCDKIIGSHGKWPHIIRELSHPEGYRDQ